MCFHIITPNIGMMILMMILVGIRFEMHFACIVSINSMAMVYIPIKMCLEPQLWFTHLTNTFDLNYGLYSYQNVPSFSYDLCFFWNALGVATPLLEECEDDTHTPEMGT